jgi:hypothetical protein
VTSTVETESGQLRVTAGYYPDGRIAELFISSGKPDSTLDRLLDDGAVLVSKLIQTGTPVGAIAAALGKRGRSPTPLARAIDWLAEQDFDAGGEL